MVEFSTFAFSGKRALVRVDFNVPLDAQFHILDDTRMRAVIPTLQKILKGGGSTILMSHLGRPKKGPEDKFSLKHLLGHLEELLGIPVQFAADCLGAEAREKSVNLHPGQVLLLENLRFYQEEEAGDPEFARKLAALGDVYVNDAFGTAHRSHASTAVIARFFPAEDRMFGLLMEAEVSHAQKVLFEAERPFTAVLGGAKVSDKIEIIDNLMSRADHIIIGGGMAFTFLKAQGKEIGNSLCESDKLELALDLIRKAQSKGVSLVLPEDAVVADRFEADAQTRLVDTDHIPSGWMGLDIGPRAVASFSRVILASRTILWNGPMGVFEMKAFQEGTRGIALAIAQATAQGAFSLVGGGDSVSAIHQFGIEKQVSYISTGGGAMLEFFEGKTLPGIAAIQTP